MNQTTSLNNFPRSARRGFTLVELLVVIGIIALLTGLLMPALNRARQQANGVKCASNLRQIGQQLLMYSQHYRGWLYPVGDIDPITHVPKTLGYEPMQPDFGKATRWPVFV